MLDTAHLPQLGYTLSDLHDWEYSDMQWKVNRKFTASLFSLSIPLVTGCASTHSETLHLYEPPNAGAGKERVFYPLDPDNCNSIFRTCEDGSFAHSSDDREFTPYGVVIKAIRCVPPSEERGSEQQDALPSLQFRFTGDPHILGEDLIAEFEGEKAQESPE